MKKLVIGLLILGNIFIVSGCDTNSNQSAQNNTTTQTTQEASQNNNQTVADENKSNDKTSNKEEINKDKVSTDSNKSNNSSNESTDKIKKDNNSKNTSSNSNKVASTETTKQAHKNTPSNNKTVENRVKEKTKNNESTQDAMTPYYGTWSIDKVIGHTLYSTNNTSPLNKTLVISKNKYVNNAFNVEIDKPKYLITKLSEKDFCKGYKMESLKGTGLNEGPITALDITSSTNPNSDFDELYIQNGYLVYLQDGVFFKCSKN